jgi:enamine deaminase RidA (YjgF/YER057c/UK114 family)
MNFIARVGQQPRRCYVPDTIAWWRRYPGISAGCEKGGLLFVAGQYGSDADGNVNTPGDHAGQARNALNRVREICELAGGGLDDVIGITSAHQDARWIDAVAEVYGSEFFDESPRASYPAWTATGAAGLLRQGMVGQYRAIADRTNGRRLASVPPQNGGGGSRVAGAAHKDGSSLVAVAALGPSNRRGEVIHRGDATAQARMAFESMGASLAKLGSSLEDLVQLTSFHLDPASMEVALEVGAKYLSAGSPPAWNSALMTGAQLDGQLHAMHGLAISRV